MKHSLQVLAAAIFVLCFAVAAASAASPVRCDKPGEIVQTDITGDSTSGLAGHDVTRLSIAEPFANGDDQITWIVELAGLDPIAPDPASKWNVRFRAPTGGTEWWVSMETCSQTQGLRFSYGFINPDLNGSFTGLGQTTGQILQNAFCVDIQASVLEQSTPSGSFTGGDVLTGCFVDVRLFGGAECTGLVSQMDATTAVPVTLCGSDACSPVPTISTSWGGLKDRFAD